MANVTITTAANYIPTYWSALILETLHKNLVGAPLLDRRFEKFARNGNTINVPGLAEIAARTLTNMTGTITFDANTESNVAISLNKLTYTAVKIDMATNVQIDYPAMEYYTGEIGRSVAEKIDTDVWTILDDHTQTVGTDNIALTDANVLRARQYLDDAKAPMNDRFMVVSPATLMDFFGIDRYVNSLYSGSVRNLDGAKGPGYIGPLYNFDVYEGTNLPAGSSGKKNFAWQREADALVMEKEISVRFAEPHDELAVAAIAWAVYGTKAMRNTSGVEMDGK